MSKHNDALEAAAVSAETWDVEKHGLCNTHYYHAGHQPKEFNCLGWHEDIFVEVAEHG